MLGLWPVEQEWKFHLIFALAWKQPGSICWRCFALWIGWIYHPLRYRSGSFSSSLNSMPSVRKRFGRWISDRELWICGLCSVTLWPHWTNGRKPALDSERISREGLIRAWPN